MLKFLVTAKKQVLQAAKFFVIPTNTIGRHRYPELRKLNGQGYLMYEKSAIHILISGKHRLYLLIPKYSPTNNPILPV